MKIYINALYYLILSYTLSAQGQTQTNGPAAELFNLGRQKVFRGFSFSADQKHLYFDSYTLAPYSGGGRPKLFRSDWSKRGWSIPVALEFLPGATHHTPILSHDGSRLYFTSSAPAPGKTVEGDQNIWYVNATSTGWSEPVFLKEINTDADERVTSVASNGDIYFTSNRQGGAGDSDIYFASRSTTGFGTPKILSDFNSPAEEIAVALDPQGRYLIIQRRTNPYTIDLFVSLREGSKWTPIRPLKYKRHNPQSTASYYSPRFLHIEDEGNTVYVNINFLLYTLSAKELLESNGIQTAAIGLKDSKPLPVARRKYGEPVPFAPNQLQVNNGFRLSPDQKTAYIAQYNQKFLDSSLPGEQRMLIMESKLENGTWSELKPVPFGDPKVSFEYNPVISPDGNRFFFNSRMNPPGSADYNNTHDKNNLVYVDKLPDGSWGPRHFVSELATDNADEDYCSVAADGTLYFHSEEPKGSGNGEIYASEWANGKYAEPQRLTVLSTRDNEEHTFVDPRERFIIFMTAKVRTSKIHETDLFISFKTGNTWSTPRALDKVNTRENWEMTPSVSPDGKTFFFEQTQNVMQVEFESLLLPAEKKLLRDSH